MQAEKTLRMFMQKVKNGKRRGEYIQAQFAENVVVELSVGPFEYGYIHLRVLVDEPRITASQGMYYRQLYTIDSKYKEIQETLQKVIEKENETPVRNTCVWEAKNKTDGHDYPWLPNGFDLYTTIFFEDSIQLRDDVTIKEAIQTNRTS